jgi:hypothetical protein
MRIPNTGLHRVKNEFTWRLLVMSVSISLWLLSSSVTLSLNSVRYFCRLAMCAAFCSACAHGKKYFLFYLHVSAGNRTRAGPLRWKASTRKEPFEQHVNSYSEHLHMSERPRRMLARISIILVKCELQKES